MCLSCPCVIRPRLHCVLRILALSEDWSLFQHVHCCSKQPPHSHPGRAILTSAQSQHCRMVPDPSRISAGKPLLGRRVPMGWAGGGGTPGSPLLSARWAVACWRHCSLARLCRNKATELPSVHTGHRAIKCLLKHHPPHRVQLTNPRDLEVPGVKHL